MTDDIKDDFYEEMQEAEEKNKPWVVVHVSRLRALTDRIKSLQQQIDTSKDEEQ